MFALRQTRKDEANDLMKNLFKIIKDSLYGVQIREDINEFYKRKSQYWMETE